MVDVFLGWEQEGGIFRMGYSSCDSLNPTSSGIPLLQSGEERGHSGGSFDG